MMIGVWSQSTTPTTVLQTAGLSSPDITPSSLILEKCDTAAILIPEFKQLAEEQTQHGYLLSGKTFLFWGENQGPDDSIIPFYPLPFSYTAITKVPEYEEMVTFDPKNRTSPLI